MSKILKLSVVAVFTGIISGVFSSSFLHLLNFVTNLRGAHPILIWGLPFFGLLYAAVLKKIPHQINQGVPYILEELENEKAQVSPWMAPFVFLSSLGTHLFGGSAGREGVGVIMGASAAHILPRFCTRFESMRRYLIYSGIAAGFSSIFGTPLAAVIFAFELHSFRHVREIDLLLCTLLASFVSLLVPHFFGPLHSAYEVTFSVGEVLPYVVISGVASGLGALIFFWGMKFYTRLISHCFPHLFVKMGIGSVFICLVVFLTKGYQYVGIGTDMIVQSFRYPMTYLDFILKALLTIMTLSLGFKGGEVTPLFFMGATLSNWSAGVLNFRNYSLSSSLGMVGLFGAVTGTPVASAIMGCELFGWKVGVFCFISCFIARLFMRKHTLYRH